MCYFTLWEYNIKRQLPVIKEVWGKSPPGRSLKSIISNKPLSSQWHKAESWTIYPRGERGKRDGNVIKSRSWNRGREIIPFVFLNHTFIGNLKKYLFNMLCVTQ